MAAESDAQKKVRRSISGKVTKILNTVATNGYPNVNNPNIGAMIRRCVLLALRDIDDGIRMLERDIQEELNLNVEQGKLIKFYTKGGNAYSCIVGTQDDITASCNVKGGSDSDWDTQIVINPWLPAAIRSRLHNEVIELSISLFKTAFEDIARQVHNQNIDVVLDLKSVAGNEEILGADDDDVKAGQYVYVLDEQQSSRKIFNYENLGMVYDDRVNLTPATGMDKKDGPGILFHTAIKPFELYRLGYLGKIFKLKPKANANDYSKPLKANDDYDDTTILPRKALAELIDITIPKIGTIEAFEVWESLAEHNIKITNKPINVNNLSDAAVPIPLPDINYHKLENLLMLCEMADGSSRHYNKLKKRVNRLKEACETQVTKGQSTDMVKIPLLHMVGVASEAQLISNNLNATNKINEHLQNHDATRWNNGHGPYQQNNSWEHFIRKLMIHVNAKANDNLNNLADNTWKTAELAKQKNNTDNNISRTQWAAIYNKYASTNNGHPQRGSNLQPSPLSTIQRYRSDDLVLLDQLLKPATRSHNIYEDPLVNTSKLKPSTITYWRIFRLDDFTTLNKVFASYFAAINDLRGEPGGNNKDLNIVHRYYTREDFRGHIPECLVITKKGEQILSICTLTTGFDARTGGTRANYPDYNTDKNSFAVLEDIARQRKLTAALIHDYTLKAILSSHYNSIRQLINID